MNFKKIENIRQASFRAMLKYSIVFTLFIVITLIIFGFFLSYIMIRSSEKDLANVLVDNIEDKEIGLESMAKEITFIMNKEGNEGYKRNLINFKIKGNEEISGILVLNDKGIVINASDKYEKFLSYDFSNHIYDENNISSSFVHQLDKDMSLSFVTPFVNSTDNSKGFVVLLIDSKFIKSSDNTMGLRYFITTKYGDIIFNNCYDNSQFVNDKVIENIKSNSFDTFVYKDDNNKYVLSTIRASKKSSAYVVIQHYIFDNDMILSWIASVSVINILLIIFLILLFSTKISNNVTKYADVVLKEVSKIEEGNYDMKVSHIYPYKEVNDFMTSFYNMGHKINQREQELLVYNEELKASNDEISNMLETIHKNEKEKHDQYIEIMHTLLNLIEIKDEYTAGHSKMVTQYATKIGEMLNDKYGFQLNLEKITVASILHDIGKIGIGSNILNKSSKLTEDEFEEIKTHSIKGYIALRNVKNLKDEAIMVKYHHERYDGTGYPEGLKGSDIPIGARIIAVADSYDAMTSDRAYRKGISKEKAVEELIRNKGTQFDPFIVDIFVEYIKSN